MLKFYLNVHQKIQQLIIRSSYHDQYPLQTERYNN
jgi:hypothetical protein